MVLPVLATKSVMHLSLVENHTDQQNFKAFKLFIISTYKKRGREEEGRAQLQYFTTILH